MGVRGCVSYNFTVPKAVERDVKDDGRRQRDGAVRDADLEGGKAWGYGRVSYTSML